MRIIQTLWYDWSKIIFIAVSASKHSINNVLWFVNFEKAFILKLQESKKLFYMYLFSRRVSTV